MDKNDLSLAYVVREPLKQRKNGTYPLLLMLHGIGSNENDLFSFVNEINDQYLVVSVRAPNSLGYGGYSWFDMDFSGNEIDYDFSEVQSSKSILLQFIKELEVIWPISRQEIMLMGFSQGAVLSYNLALNNPGRIAAVVAMSGYIPEEQFKTFTYEKALKNLNFFVTHGTEDDIIPIDLARKSVAFLEKHDLHVLYKEYTMGHAIAPPCLSDVINWVNKYFK